MYIERINVRGNTRTRDYVIRREFDIGEGDPYNKVLIDRAERRLNSLGFFKKVKITNETGSSLRPCHHQRGRRGSAHRFFLDLRRLFDQPTVSSPKLAVTESNFLGRGPVRQTRRCRKGSMPAASTSRSPSRTSSIPVIAAGFDLFAKQSDNSQYSDLQAAS